MSLWLRRHAVLVCLAAAYLVVFPYFRKLESPNENVRIWATRALAHHGTWAIDEVVREWGPVTDTARVDGRRYSSKAPGTTLLGVPVHFVHDRVVRLFTGRSPSPMTSTWVLRVTTVIAPLLFFFGLFARRVEAESGSPLARDLLTLGLGAGTLMYPYGLTFVGHAQSAALLFAGFLALVPRDGSPARARLALAGALTGLAVVFEYQALFAAAVLALFATATLRARVWPFLLGALAPALLLGAYHAALFGGPFSLPYAHLDDAAYATYHHSQGFLGLGRPRARVLRSAFFSVDYGLFVYSPFLVLGLLAALWATIRRGGVVPGLVLAVTVVMAVFLSGMANWRGGWCAAGPRYIAVVVPLLAFALAWSWRALFAPRPWAQGVLFGLTLASLVAAGLSGLYPHFPVQLDNPLFDLLVPLLVQGYVPHGLGTALGVGGLASLLPWLLALGAAVVLVARQLPDWRARAAGIGLAVLIVGALGLAGSRGTREDQRVRARVIEMWEPLSARRS